MLGVGGSLLMVIRSRLKSGVFRGVPNPIWAQIRAQWYKIIYIFVKSQKQKKLRVLYVSSFLKRSFYVLKVDPKYFI
jgi:hypothetical protein